MSTSVTYKGSPLTTVNNETKILETAGTYLEDDITLVDVTVSYEDGNNLEYGIINNASPLVGVGKIGSMIIE